MKKTVRVFTLATIWSSTLLASPDDVQVQDQLVIQVKGIVCSFCAYGAEKNLSKLSFLDKSQYGDGVLVDIETHRVTLALDPEAIVQYAEISDAITRGGYDPVAYYPVIHGELHEKNGRLLLTSTDTGQVYLLPEDTEAEFAMGQIVSCRAELGPEAAADYIPGNPVMLTHAVLETLEQ